MGCFGGDNEDNAKGIVTKRRCRDVPCLLVFGVFWGGMFVVAFQAFTLGDPRRILYGLDSYGQYCGLKNTHANGTTIDLRGATKLYYINPLELLDPSNYKYAKTVCVSECPSAAQRCLPTALPCRRNDQFVCPYYNFSTFGAKDGLGVLSSARSANKLSAGVASTNWWANLTNLATKDCVDPATLASVPAAISSAMDTTRSCGNYYQTTSMYPGKGPCSAIYFETSEYMQRCYPVIPEEYYGLIKKSGAAALGASAINASSGAISSVVDNVSKLSDGGWNTYVTDAQRGFVIVVVAGLAVSLFLCLIYMMILIWFAGFLAWTTIFLINALAVAVTLLCAHKAGLLGGSATGALGASLDNVLTTSTGDSLTGQNQRVMQIITYVLAAVTLLIFLFTLIMIKRVRIAIACLKVAAKAVSAMPSLLLFPLVSFVSFVILFVYFVFVLTYLWSAGDVVPTYREVPVAQQSYTLSTLYSAATANTSFPQFSSPPPPPPPPPLSNRTIPCYDDPHCYYSVKFSKTLQYLFAYHIFGFLWTNQFIIGFGYVVISGAVAQYYWHRGISAEMPRLPVLLSVRYASTYHLGSIAFGAFIVAIIQFVRLILEYIDRKTKRMQRGNPAAKWVMCCLRYCLWYLEKVMKFINRNAFIMVAVKGSSYCGSAIRAIKLLISNALALAAVNIIGDILIFLGKMSVVAGATVVAFLMTDLKCYTNPTSNTYLSSPVIPVVLSAIAAYVVANIFFSVYEMAVDTILLSFCEDCESNNGAPLFAPKLLMAAIGKGKEFEQQQEERRQRKGAKVIDQASKP